MLLLKNNIQLLAHPIPFVFLLLFSPKTFIYNEEIFVEKPANISLNTHLYVCFSVSFSSVSVITKHFRAFARFLFFENYNL